MEIDLRFIAEILGKSEKDLKKPYRIKDFNILPGDLPKIIRNLKKFELDREEEVVISVAMPLWLGLALVNLAYPATVVFHDPKFGRMPVRINQPKGKGRSRNLRFAVEEKENFILLTLNLLKFCRFDYVDLGAVIPPVIPFGKGLVIVPYSRCSNWFFSSVAMSYCQVVRWIAVPINMKKAVVAVSRSPAVSPGEITRI